MIRYFEVNNSFIVPGVVTAATIQLGTYTMQSPCSLRSVSLMPQLVAGGYKDIIFSLNVQPSGFKWFFPNSGLYTAAGGSLELNQLILTTSTPAGCKTLNFEPGAMPIAAGGQLAMNVFCYATFAAADQPQATVVLGIEFPDSGKAVVGQGQIKTSPGKVFLKDH